MKAFLVSKRDLLNSFYGTFMLPPPRQSVIANEILKELVREKPIAKLKKTYPSFIAFLAGFLDKYDVARNNNR